MAGEGSAVAVRDHHQRQVVADDGRIDGQILADQAQLDRGGGPVGRVPGRRFHGPAVGAGDREPAAEIEEELPDPAAAETGEAEQRELRDWVRRGLDLLSPEQRMTLELAYYLGQSCEEIAAIMNCASGTVKARMFHARLRLRNSLPGLGGEPAPAANSSSVRN